jgi:hypothetical protein
MSAQSSSKILAIARFLQFLAGILLFSTTCSFAADHTLCGNPPPVENVEEKDELDGKVDFFKRFIGTAELKGKISQTKTEIFSKYRNKDERSLAYMQYQMCIIIMDDTTLTTSEKLKQIREIHDEFVDKKSPVIDYEDEHRTLHLLYTAGVKDRFTNKKPLLEDASGRVIDLQDVQVHVQWMGIGGTFQSKMDLEFSGKYDERPLAYCEDPNHSIFLEYKSSNNCASEDPGCNCIIVSCR